MSRYNEISQMPDTDRFRDIRASYFSPVSNRHSEFSTNKSPRKAAIFSNDQEIFIDSSSPLILICENNPNLRFNHLHPLSSRRKDDATENADSLILANVSRPRASIASSYADETAALKINQTVDSQGSRSSKRLKGSILDPALKATEASPEKVDIFEDEEPEETQIKEYKEFKTKLIKILDSAGFNYFMGVFIIYALFSDDFRTLIFKPSVDLGFDVLSFIAITVFSLEIIVTLYVKPEYKWSFFFWLDLVSTVSIIFDIQMISGDFFPAGTANTAQLARASRASRIGARAGRVVRIFRLVRLVKLYKHVNKRQKDKDKKLIRTKSLEKVHPEIEGSPALKSRATLNMIGTQNEIELTKKGTLKAQNSLWYSKTLKDHVKHPTPSKEKITDEVDSEDITLKESRVGKKLSDLTTKRVIVIVLALLMVIPFFSADFFFDPSASHYYEFNLLSGILSNSTISDAAKQAAIAGYIAQESANNPNLIYLRLGDIIYFSTTNDSSLYTPSDLRDDEQDSITISQSNGGTLLSIVSLKPKVVLTSGLNIARTIFVCVVLIVGSLLFSKDANNLALRPIERMIEKVNKIAKNPLIAKEEGLVRDHNAGLENETVQIENAIIKIGGLLALGFGDAGSAIIAQNISKSGDLNPMLPGQKELAIFGFCDIRNFTDVTEVLQEEVMVFVNSIADIVHSMVDMYTGAANKNIGDAFLLVWKFPNTEIIENEDLTLEARNSKVIQAMADLALLSFIKINIKINRDPTLIAYRSNPDLNVRLPNYKVKMGFGLHVGWAIEGAIGSEFKIDASYLSPNVNLASRLEAATKQYGVPLLFSGELYYKLSKPIKQKARLIDIVTVKGSLLPMELYTVDIDVNDLIPSNERKLMSALEKREVQKLRKNMVWEDALSKGSIYLVENDRELIHAFRNFDPEFNDIFAEGFQAYVQGDWSTSKKNFEECLEIRSEDGPTKNLLNFLKENDYIAPEDWKGYRVLTEK